MDWFTGLELAKKTSWATLQEELKEARITEEELGKKVAVNGVEVYTHFAWADRVERLAKAISDTNNLLVKGTRDGMAPSLRSLVPHTMDT
ncbi:hypothetical protein H0H92_009536 [Tricholoma furcatifolium]|nr:hypothetical protein H0H92_009536 [Tricholoma furcatifolium]